MRLDIVNNTSHADVPVDEIHELVGVQLFHLCQPSRWPEARYVVADLVRQGFYLNLVDDLPEAKDALGYHATDEHGIPYAKVAVGPSLAAGSDWLTGPYSVLSVVGHEAIETCLDPLCNRWVSRGGDDDLVAHEGCDAVQGLNYDHRGCSHSNFVLPAWFNPFGVVPFDYMGTLTAPFQLGDGGYTLVDTGGRVEQQFAVQAPPAWRTQGTRAAIRGAWDGEP